jgi:RNAse (barnase) inhibitor barstar
MYYYRDINDIETKNSFVAKFELTDNFIEECYVKLKFPDYFGFNLDALQDCLLDFSWLEESTIIIIIDSVSLSSESNLRDYVGLFCEVEKRWMQYNEKYSLESDEIYNQYRRQLHWLSENEIKRIAQPRNVKFYFNESEKEYIEGLIREM